MNAIDFHAGIATQFDRRYASSADFRQRFRIWTALFDRYVKPSDNVLDMGCGSGVFSRYLADRGCTVTAVDGSLAMIRLCVGKGTDNVSYIHERLPFVDCSNYAGQDVVVASSLLEYMADLAPVLQQIQYVLKTNGLLVVSMPNRRSLYRRAERALFALTGYPRYYAHVHNVLTPVDFTRQLNQLGFQPIELRYLSNSDPVSKLFTGILPAPYVNNMFVGVYQKKSSTLYPSPTVPIPA